MLLVPGIVILFVRSYFLTGRRPSHQSALLSYLIVTLLYWVAATPVLAALTDDSWLSVDDQLLWVVTVFLIPAVLGFAFGLELHAEWFRKLLRRFGINPVHEVANTWDWKFGRSQVQWVLVSLVDGTRFAGIFDEKSFASSELSERDLYIRYVHKIDENDNWEPPRTEHSVLIRGHSIQTVEFFPYQPLGESDGEGSQ